MLTRALTGIVFVGVLVGCIVWSPLSLVGLCLVVSMIGLWEFYELAEKGGAHPQRVIGLLGGLGLYIFAALVYLNPHFSDILEWGILFIPLFGIVAVTELFRNRENPINNIAYTLLGWLYVILPFALFLFIATYSFESLRESETTMDYFEGLLFPFYEVSYNWKIALGFFIIIWANDTFAYLTGKAIGKHKLFERISPNKTWEGTLGGIAFGIGASALLWYFWPVMPLSHWLLMGFVVTIFGNLGDLVESMLKRSVGVKDSGNILPGHGGILDRFDSMILAAPMAFVLLQLLKWCGG